MASFETKRRRLRKIKKENLYSYTEMSEQVGISHVKLQDFMKGGDIKQKRIKIAIDDYINTL